MFRVGLSLKLEDIAEDARRYDRQRVDRQTWLAERSGEFERDPQQAPVAPISEQDTDQRQFPEEPFNP